MCTRVINIVCVPHHWVFVVDVQSYWWTKISWSMKTRRALSRHCYVAWVYGQTTTAIHDDEYIPILGVCMIA